MVIAIDGTSASGKSTISKELASRLNIDVFNVGMVYRAICLHMTEKGILPSDDDRIQKEIESIKLDVLFNCGEQIVLVNGLQKTTEQLFSSEASALTPLFALKEELRQIVRVFQREYANQHSVLMEGRDVTSEVLPNADYKFFINCDYYIKAKRRECQLKELGENKTCSQILDELHKRDMEDINRQVSPLIFVDGVVYIDTSNLSLDQTIDKMIKMIKGGIKNV